MKHFAELINTLTNARNEDSKVRAVFRYFNSKNHSESFDAVAGLLVGQYIPPLLTSRQLKSWVPSLLPQIPEWLIDRSVEESGNIVNAMALLLRKNKSGPNNPSLPEALEKLRKLHGTDEDSLKMFLTEELARYGQFERAVILRMMTGSFKSPVTRIELLRGLARVFEIPEAVAALRWYDLVKKKAFEFHKLGKPLEAEEDLLPIEIKPPEIIENPGESLGDWNNWLAYGIRTGIACQLVKHGETVHLWAGQHEIITDLFPEIAQIIRNHYTDVVLIGQLTPLTSETPLSVLEGIIAGKSDIDQRSFVFIIRDAFVRQSGLLKRIPVEDLSGLSITKYLVPESTLVCSTWEELKELNIHCSEVGYDGILLKSRFRHEPSYLWMATSRRVKAVLMYVEIDRMNGIKTMTFGMYRNGGLVPVAKVPLESGGAFVDDIISFVKANTIQRFGPVRTVNPALVYELNYEGVEHSVRKKAGLTLLNPSIYSKIGENSDVADLVEVLTLKN